MAYALPVERFELSDTDFGDGFMPVSRKASPVFRTSRRWPFAFRREGHHIEERTAIAARTQSSRESQRLLDVLFVRSSLISRLSDERRALQLRATERVSNATVLHSAAWSG
jgi:hypothetical protein